MNGRHFDSDRLIKLMKGYLGPEVRITQYQTVKIWRSAYKAGRVAPIAAV